MTGKSLVLFTVTKTKRERLFSRSLFYRVSRGATLATDRTTPNRVVTDRATPNGVVTDRVVMLRSPLLPFP